jgi:RHS repeat-associated protein
VIFKVLKAESESRNGVRPGSRGGSLLKEGGRRIFCDSLGRRIQKEVTIGSQNKTTNFYYSGHQVIEERDGSDQVTRQLIYGNGIDEVIRVDKYNGSTSTPYYLHINDMGSITAVTDANGNIIERVYYDIYGMPTFKDAAGNVIPKSSIGNNILFQGREYDPELNLYYFRARYYDPIMGRFLSTDPMGYADSMNLYQAFGMNPVNFLDPMGKLYARFRFIEKPVEFKTDIPKNPNYKPGKTSLEVPLFEVVWKYIKDEGSGMYYWMPDIHINLEIYIWYLRDSLYTKEHEWRHAVDILIGFANIIDRMRRIERETKVYLDELKDLSQLKHHELAIEQYIESELKGFIKNSAFRRDSLLSPYFLWYDLLDWLIDRILSRSGGEKYEKEYVWKDN